MAFKLKRGATLPASRWISFLPLGEGDDNQTTFPVPASPLLEKASGFFVAAGQNRVNKRYALKEKDSDGNTHLQIKAKVERDEDGLPTSVVFEKPLPEGMPATLILLDVKDEAPGHLSLAVLPMTRGTKALTDTASKLEKDRLKLKDKDDLPPESWYRLTFLCLTDGWSGVEDEAGGPAPCTEEMKDAFLCAHDGWTYGCFIVEASHAFGAGIGQDEKVAQGNS